MRASAARRSRCPVLVIQGRDDDFGTLEQVDAIVQGVGGPAETLVLDHCGHIPHREKPGEVLAAVTRFISDDSDDRGSVPSASGLTSCRYFTVFPFAPASAPASCISTDPAFSMFMMAVATASMSMSGYSSPATHANLKSSIARGCVAVLGAHEVVDVEDAARAVDEARDLERREARAGSRAPRARPAEPRRRARPPATPGPRPRPGRPPPPPRPPAAASFCASARERPELLASGTSSASSCARALGGRRPRPECPSACGRSLNTASSFAASAARTASRPVTSVFTVDATPGVACAILLHRLDAAASALVRAAHLVLGRRVARRQRVLVAGDQPHALAGHLG